MENKSEFEFKVHGNPDYSLIEVSIPEEKKLKIEGAAMAAMSSNIELKTKWRGGFSRLITGENLFINEASAKGGQAQIDIAPGPPGDIGFYRLENDSIYLSSSTFVASSMEINVESKWQGMAKGFFAGNGLFLIKCSGTGDLWFNSFGSMFEINVEDEYVVDNGHIVGFTEGLNYQLEKLGGYKSLFFSGEGLVCRFRGQGRVWIQSKNVSGFANWLHPFRRVKKKRKNS